MTSYRTYSQFLADQNAMLYGWLFAGYCRLSDCPFILL